MSIHPKHLSYVIAALVLVLAIAAVLFTTVERPQPIGFTPTDNHLAINMQSAQKGDYLIQGTRLTVYLGKGSGENRAKIAQVEERDRQLFITVAADFCGTTRDSRPLYASAELVSPPRSSLEFTGEPAPPAKVTIDSEPC